LETLSYYVGSRRAFANAIIPFAMTTEAAAPAAYRVLDRDITLPVEVRDATAAVAYYLVSSRAAQRLIDASGLRIASVLPGKTLCTIGAMDYRDGDLGPYHEIAVSFFVRERDQRSLPVVGTAVDFARNRLGAYIHKLPVDGEFTREAGVSIWGFPKFMSEIDISNENEWETATLRVDGRHVLTQRMRLEGTRSFPEREQNSYAYRDGVTYRTPSVMRGERIGARFRGASIELGDHPLAEELRSLGLPQRALFSTYIGKMSATFGAAEAVPGTRERQR
jgi:Acetoacetate decarboxylase (ADC)